MMKTMWPEKEGPDDAMAGKSVGFWLLVREVCVSAAVAIPSRMRQMKDTPKSFLKLFPHLYDHGPNFPNAPCFYATVLGEVTLRTHELSCGGDF